jgi:hypothetical protein
VLAARAAWSSARRALGARLELGRRDPRPCARAAWRGRMALRGGKGARPRELRRGRAAARRGLPAWRPGAASRRGGSARPASAAARHGGSVRRTVPSARPDAQCPSVVRAVPGMASPYAQRPGAARGLRGQPGVSCATRPCPARLALVPCEAVTYVLCAYGLAGRGHRGRVAIVIHCAEVFASSSSCSAYMPNVVRLRSAVRRRLR